MHIFFLVRDQRLNSRNIPLLHMIVLPGHLDRYVELTRNLFIIVSRLQLPREALHNFANQLPSRSSILQNFFADTFVVFLLLYLLNEALLRAYAFRRLGLKNIFVTCLKLELFWVDAKLSMNLEIMAHFHHFLCIFKYFIVLELHTRLVKHCLLEHSGLMSSLDLCKWVVCVKNANAVVTFLHIIIF